MKRLPLIFSTCALAVALLGSTPLGHAAGRAVAKIVPFAQRAGTANVAKNALRLNGHAASRSGAPGTIPVVGANGKLPLLRARPAARARPARAVRRGPPAPPVPPARRARTGS